ncbi:MAG: heavy-metal-associated domain-containing protein [Rhodothermales bacterium]|nr:heavy-metal-associated domain-containing protein [Rhodothermales bacterium]
METPAPASRTLRIDGMSCGHCVRAVREALGSVEGLAVDEVQVGEATVRPADSSVSWDALEPRVRDAVGAAGYALA